MSAKISGVMLFVLAVILSHEVNAQAVFVDDSSILDDPPTQIALLPARF